MNTFGNWQDTTEIARQRCERSLARAQAKHDAKGPPEERSCSEACPDCAGSGFQPDGETECLRCTGDGTIATHDWHLLRGEAKDGTRFSRCRRCGLEVES